MNIPANCDWSDPEGEAYRAGHRDARHAAAELVAAHASQPKPRPEGTVRVRGLVALLFDGRYQMFGFQNATDAELRQMVCDFCDDMPDQTDFIEVEIPVRHSETIQGEVTP